MAKTIDEMISLPGQKPFFSIEFHGGEPLAHFPTIRRAVECGKNVNRKREFQFYIKFNQMVQ